MRVGFFAQTRKVNVRPKEMFPMGNSARYQLLAGSCPRCYTALA